MTPDAVRAALQQRLLAAGFYRLALGARRLPGIAVLGYHGLRPDDLPDEALAFPNWHLAASRFDAHCRVLASHCDLLSLDDWRAIRAGRVPRPRRPVLVTFDDAYRSVWTIGAPILRRHGVPAAVFACSEPSYGRTRLWFDEAARTLGAAGVETSKHDSYAALVARVAACGPIPDDDPEAVMAPSELRAFAAQAGIEIGSHTRRHAILARATPDEQRMELAESQRTLSEWTGRPVRALAYPNGRPGVDYTGDTVAAAHACGFDVAFSTRPAFALQTDPDLEQPRFLLTAAVSPAILLHRLAFSWAR